MKILVGLNVFNIYSGKYDHTGYNLENLPMLVYKKGNTKANPKMKYIRGLTSDSFLINLLYKLKGIRMTRMDNNKCQVNFGDETVEFYKMSDILSDDGDKDTAVLKKELLNYRKRSGHCHTNCMKYLTSFGERIVSGYIDDIAMPNRAVHSWLETGEYVVDYTKNLVINREYYYRFLNPEVLSVITLDQLYNDVVLLRQMDFLGSRFYCLFREEIVNDLINKNNNFLNDIGYEKKLK